MSSGFAQKDIREWAARLVHTSIDDARVALANMKAGDSEADVEVLRCAIEMEQTREQPRSSLLRMLRAALKRLTPVEAVLVDPDAAPKGRGRPAKILALAGARTLAERATAVNEYHLHFQSAAGQAVGFAALAGMELLAARAEVRHGLWLDWVGENCAFSDDTARRYMTLAERLAPQLAEGSHTRRLLGVAPSAMTEESRASLTAALQAAADGQTLTGIYESMGIVRGPREIKIGGNAALVAWLREHHPGIRATKRADLPEAIRQEYERWAVEQRAEKKGVDVADLEAMEAAATFEHLVAGLREYALVTKRYVHLDAAALQAGLASLKDVVRELSQARS